MELKPGLGAFYAIWPADESELLHSSQGMCRAEECQADADTRTKPTD